MRILMFAYPDNVLLLAVSFHAFMQIDSFSKDLADMDALYVIVKGEMGQLAALSMGNVP